jgi:tRNA/tmRNA/rRNA uracil-C5-methylase (TrmA/RlmC/RlmD family)
MDKSPYICQHFELCSGCSFNLDASSPPIWENVLAFFQSQELSSIRLYTGPNLHWRCRAKVAVRGTSQNPLIGLFKAGSHDVVPIPFCQIHHPVINMALERIQALIKAEDLSPYNESSGQGELRYLQFVVQRATGKLQATFVLNFKDMSDEKAKRWQTLLTAMAHADDFWHSIWINLNPQLTNTILGPNWHLCYGQELLWEQFGDISVCYQPASFAQANLDLFEKMLQRLPKIIPAQVKLAEFYAGVGVMGLFLASHCAWVRCAEVNPNAKFCFTRSRKKLPSEIASRVSFHTGDANGLLSILSGADTALVDPPRKGLEAPLLKAFNSPHSSLKQLVYISCGWESFKRDCQALIDGGWRLAHAEGYWFFPGSDHIEILASFKKGY